MQQVPVCIFFIEEEEGPNGMANLFRDSGLEKPDPIESVIYKLTFAGREAVEEIVLTEYPYVYVNKK